MRIEQIWNELDKDTSHVKGLLFRRYSAEVKPDVFVAIQNPEKEYCIFFEIKESIKLNTSSLLNSQEINIDLFPSPIEFDKRVLLLRLMNKEHRDIFGVLCEDLIENIANETDEKVVIREILNRMEKWKSLFNKITSQGLSPEEQRGLFGELYFLRKFLRNGNQHLAVVNTWVGSEKQIRDFQNSSWAVEVKTTLGNNHQKIHISSERQLDTTNLDYLYLYHISLERQTNSGETLNGMIHSIFEILRNDLIAINRFKFKIFEIGYFDTHKNLYENIGYHIRRDVYYKVENDFPRLEEKDIPDGIGDIKYSIILSKCTSFMISETQLFDSITINLH